MLVVLIGRRGLSRRCRGRSPGRSPVSGGTGSSQLTSQRPGPEVTSALVAPLDETVHTVIENRVPFVRSSRGRSTDADDADFTEPSSPGQPVSRYR